MVTSPPTRAHLVLGGGGALCLSYAGALCAFEERGIEFASVSTCSAGTFIGALLCCGLTPRDIEAEICNLSPLKLVGDPSFPRPLSYLAVLKWPYAIYRAAGFPAEFQRILKGRDPTFAELDIPFATAGVDISFNKFLVYASETHHDMKVSEALAIAVSFPVAYPPYEPEGRIILDAGIASECPVWLAAGRDDPLPIIALRPAKPTRLRRPGSLLEYVAQVSGSAARCRDDDLIEQTSGVHLIEIDCGDFRADHFDLTSDELHTLTGAGRASVQRQLDVQGTDLSSLPVTPEISPAQETAASRAEARGNRLRAQFNLSLSHELRNPVFISYSHTDDYWLKRVLVHLKAFFPPVALLPWSDEQILPGEDWENAIGRALKASSAALLLVSPDFLASDYIGQRELPRILEARATRGLKVLWVPLRSSAWEETPLANIQAAYPTDTPIASLSGDHVDRALKEIGRQVKDAAENPGIETEADGD